MDFSPHERNSKTASSRPRRAPGSPAAAVPDRTQTGNPQLLRRASSNAPRINAPVEQYVGPGISITDDISKYTSGWNSTADDHLQIENTRLREEIVHLKGLLETTEGYHNDPSPKAQDRRAWMKLSAHCAQLQRQVAVMDAELRARTSLMQEAEASLEETVEQIGNLQGEDVITGARLKALQQWASALVHRLQRSKAEAAKRTTRQGLAQLYGSEASSSGVDRGQCTWEVPYIPAGGNPFLAQPQPNRSRTLTVSGLVLGQQPAALDAAAVQTLEQQLCGLGPRLEGLSVLLQTTLQPCLEWMSPFIQDYCKDDLAALARQVSQVSTSLVELACVSSIQRSSYATSVQSQRPRQPAAFIPTEGADELSQTTVSSSHYHHLASQLKTVMDELSGHIAFLPRERRSSGKSAAGSLKELVDRWIMLSMSDAELYAGLRKEVSWVKSVVTEQAKAVAGLLHHVAAVQHSLEEHGADAGTTKTTFHVAAALRKVDEARECLEQRPSEDALKALVHTLSTHSNCLAAAAELLTAGPSTIQQEQLRTELDRILSRYEEALAKMHGGGPPASTNVPSPPQPPGSKGASSTAARKKPLHQREWVD